MEVKTITLPSTNRIVDPLVEEKFKDVDIKKISFPDTWAFWESMKCNSKQNATTNFIDNNFLIFEFNNLETLAKIWRTKISNVSSFFCFEGKLVAVQDKNNRLKNIEAICMFKKNIQPAWEDPQNSAGGEFQTVFDNIDNKQEVIDAIFKEVIVAILSEEYPFRAETNGIRLVDKNRDGRSKIRLEIWFNFSDNKTEINTQKIKELSALFSQIILNHHPTVDLQFKNHSH